MSKETDRHIAVTLPYPPSVNAYFRAKGNRVYLTDDARQYKRAVKLMLGNRFDMFTGRVAVNVSIFRPRKSGDLDNRLKVMLDALQGVAYENDSQITEIHAFRYDDKENPRVEVLIYEDTDD